jgi:glycosyltransferase 2 family protein
MSETAKPKRLTPGRLFWLALLAALLYWALRNAPLSEIWESLKLLQAWQLAALLALNTGIFALITARWWIIVRAEARRVPFLPLVAYRLAAFGMSYFTPGPQVGGEPLQILYLKNAYGLTTVRATAAVIMDKLLEFLANFLFLALGLFAVAASGMLGSFAPPAWAAVPVALLLLWPIIHISLLYRRRHPLSALIRPIHKRIS